MNSIKYYGIADNEYSTYKTYDNGKTWQRIGASMGGALPLNNGRIIIFSNDNMGLRYTDDGFVTIEDSNVTDGNWKRIDMPKNEKRELISTDVYALSQDGRGIWISKDNGESWDLFADGTGDKLAIKDDKIYIYGNGDTVESPPTAIYPNSTFNGEKVESNSPVVQMGGLLYMLNEVIIPSLCLNLTGNKNIEDLRYRNSNDKIYRNFWTDGETYRVNPVGIDWWADVGMAPFSLEDLETEDFKEQVNEIKNLPKEGREELKITEKLRDTFNFMEEALYNKQEYFKEIEIKNIMQEPNDYEGLDNEEAAYIAPFYDVLKTTKASIIGTIINSIFTFDDDKKATLLKESIISTADFMKGPINENIVELTKDIDNDELSYKELYSKYERAFTYDLLDIWEKELNECIDDYYYMCRSNINKISENENKEYINIASEKYSSIRESLLNIAESLVKGLRKKETFSAEKNMAQQFDVFMKSLDDLFSQIGDLSDEEVDARILRIFETFSEEKNRLYQFDGSYGLDDFLESQIAELERGLTATISTRDFNFDADDFAESMSNLTPEEVNTVRKYYEDIFSKFKERCQSLLRISGVAIKNDIISVFDIESDLKEYTDKLIAYCHEDGFSYEKFKNKNSLASIRQINVMNFGSNYLNALKHEWIKNKGRI